MTWWYAGVVAAKCTMSKVQRAMESRDRVVRSIFVARVTLLRFHHGLFQSFQTIIIFEFVDLVALKIVSNFDIVKLKLRQQGKT